MKLDYSALNQPLEKVDITNFKAWPVAKGRSYNFLVGVIFILAALPLAVSLIGEIISGRMPGVASVAVIAVLLSLLWLGYWAINLRIKKLAKLYKFAQANNLELVCNISDPGGLGMIFDEGHSRKLSEGLRFPDGIEIANYSYVTGSGKNSQTHRWSYVRIKLGRRMPHMVLDSKKNNFLGRFSNLPEGFDRKQVLSLEGDFDNYFKLYAPREYERDALYLFTPNVMAVVIDAGQAFDMEVIDDELIIYKQGSLKIDSAEQLAALMEIIEQISGKVRHQNRLYADERVGDRSLNLVSQPGQRLKSGLSLGTILLIVVVVVYFMTLLI